LLERQRIGSFRGQGHTVREIARRLGRSASTVSRELRRNTSGHDRGRYGGDLAHARTRERARRPRRPVLAREPELRELVRAKLELEWSPEQIAGHLRDAYPDRREWHVCHETIYQALYHRAKGGLSRTLTTRLRTGRPLRKRRRSAAARRVRFIAEGRLIDHRPEIVAARTRLGDWEGDRIVGRMSRSAIGTLVDRRSRYVPADPSSGRALCASAADRYLHSTASVAGTGTADVDLGSGLGDGRAPPVRRPVHRRHLLRSPGQPVAARQ
jgi:IS30 family transposase